MSIPKAIAIVVATSLPLVALTVMVFVSSAGRGMKTADTPTLPASVTATQEMVGLLLGDMAEADAAVKRVETGFRNKCDGPARDSPANGTS